MPNEFSAADFADNGLAIFPGAIPPDALDRLRRRIDVMIEDFDPTGVKTVFSTDDQSHGRDEYFLTSGDKVRFFFEDGVFDQAGDLQVEKSQSLNKIGHAMHDLDPEFSTFCRSGELADVAEAIGLVDPALLQSMVIFKNPHVGGEVSPHTDHTFLWTEPQSVVGLWVAIDEATEQNGCLWALPGAHKTPVKSRFVRTVDGQGTEMTTFDTSPYPEDGWIPLPASPGTVIALHGSLPHRSEPNRSAKPRLAFTLHCIESSAHYPANNWLQRPDLALKGFE